MTAAMHSWRGSQEFRRHGLHVLGSFIFGLPSDRASTSSTRHCRSHERAGVTFAQFVMLTPFPGTLDFAALEKSLGADAPRIGGVPISRHWLIPQGKRPKVYMDHPVMNPTRSAIAPRPYGIGSIRCQASGRVRASGLFAEGAPGLRPHLEDLSPDVREHRDCHRQRPCQSFGALGAPDNDPCRRLFAGRPMPELQIARPAGRVILAADATHGVVRTPPHSLNRGLPGACNSVQGYITRTSSRDISKQPCTDDRCAGGSRDALAGWRQTFGSDGCRHRRAPDNQESRGPREFQGPVFAPRPA